VMCDLVDTTFVKVDVFYGFHAPNEVRIVFVCS
jgi:hypothetical protein